MFQFEFNPITGNLDYVLSPKKLQCKILDSILIELDETIPGCPMTRVLTDECNVIYSELECN